MAAALAITAGGSALSSATVVGQRSEEGAIVMGRVEGNYGGFLFKNAVQAGLNTARRRAKRRTTSRSSRRGLIPHHKAFTSRLASSLRLPNQRGRVGFTRGLILEAG
jgi:hypothetical protein